MKKENLKIDIRAVPYSDSSHVLEYRFNPNQDLTYWKEHNWFFGLIKFKTKHKYSTKWIQPVRFFNSVTSYLYSENDSWNNNHPIFVHSKDELENMKYKWQIYGQFLNWYLDEDRKQHDAYWKERNAYLKQHTVWD